MATYNPKLSSIFELLFVWALFLMSINMTSSLVHGDPNLSELTTPTVSVLRTKLHKPAELKHLRPEIPNFPKPRKSLLHKIKVPSFRKPELKPLPEIEVPSKPKGELSPSPKIENPPPPKPEPKDEEKPVPSKPDHELPPSPTNIHFLPKPDWPKIGVPAWRKPEWPKFRIPTLSKPKLPLLPKWHPIPKNFISKPFPELPKGFPSPPISPPDSTKA